MSDLIEALREAGKGSFPCPSCGAQASDDTDYPHCPTGCTAEQMEAAHNDRPPKCSDHDGNVTHAKCVACQTEAAYARAMGQRLAFSMGDNGDGWAPESLRDVPPPPAPSVLAIAVDRFLCRRGWVHLFHGVQASAKTPLTYLAVVEQVKAGNLAMIVDYEMSPGQAKATLMEMGLTDDEIHEGVYYLYQPRPMSPSGQQRIRAEIESCDRELTVVVIDSLTESMASVPGTSDNDALDVAAWGKELPTWLATTFNAAVLVIDHSALGDGPRPSGSHKKREFVQFHVWVKLEDDFSREQPERGRSSLRVMKDRSGDSVIKGVVGEIRTHPGGSFYVAPAEPSKPGEIDVPLDQQPENSNDEDVYESVKSAGEAGAMSVDITGSGAAGKYRRRGLARLLKEGRVVKRPSGRGKGTRYWVTDLAPPE